MVVLETLNDVIFTGVIGGPLSPTTRIYLAISYLAISYLAISYLAISYLMFSLFLFYEK